MVTAAIGSDSRHLDSCICIDWMRKQLTETRPEALPDGVLSAIVVAELLVAATKHHHAVRRRTQVEQLVSMTTVLPFDADAASHYGDIRAHLEKKGTPIGPMDMLIAAHARSLGATLLTLNAREFKKVPGLRILTP